MIKLATGALIFLTAIVLTFVWMAELLVSPNNGFEPPTISKPAAESFSVINANVGNADPRCAFQLLKLCRSDTEARLTENLAALRPEVAILQETLPDHLCDMSPLNDPGHVCVWQYDEPMVRRLLGPDYTIMCEEANLIECIGIRTDAGQIEGCDPGELCISDRVVEIPDGCRTHLTVYAATVTVHSRTFDIVNAHPENRSAECRWHSLQQVFEGDLVQSEDVLIAGDLNLDPWLGDDVSTAYWNTWVGPSETHAYHYHSGPAEVIPPHPTVRYPLFVRTLDHVASNFLEGSLVTLGEAPGTLRLDGGRGTDHRAIYGWLSFPEN